MSLNDFELEPDATEVPRQWWGKAEPFRGLGPVRVCAPDTDAAAATSALIDGSRALIDAVLTHPHTDPHLAEPGRDYLRSPATADPEAAAVIGLIVLRLPDPNLDRSAVADYLSHAHSLAFAATALTRMAELSIVDPRFPDSVWSSTFGEPMLRRVPSPGTTYLTQRPMRRMRALLAAAPEAEYAAARDRLAPVRIGGPANPATTFLLPTEQDWLAADLAFVGTEATDEVAAARLLACVRDPGHAQALIGRVRAHTLSSWPELIHSLGVQLGLGCTDVLVRLYRRIAEAKPRRRIVTMLTQLDTYEALMALLNLLDAPYVQPALIDIAARAPRRALWLFGSTAPNSATAELFRAHLRVHPDVARSALDCALPQGMREVVRAELAALGATDPAPPDHVPEILRNPPWARPRPEPQVVVGLAHPSQVRVAWKPGERERWLIPKFGDEALHRALGEYGYPHRPPLPGAAPVTMSGFAARALASLDLAAAQPWLRAGSFRRVDPWDLMPLLAQHGSAAHAIVCDALDHCIRTLEPELAPVASPGMLALVVRALERRTLRATAFDWLRRHPGYAATALIPTAVGTPGRERRSAENALRTLDELGFRDEISTAAIEYGDAALAATLAVLVTDPITILPNRMPSPPSWLAPTALPPIALADGGHTLPLPAVEHLLTMMRLSEPGAPYPGLARVKAACDPASLAAAVRTVHEQWRRAGAHTRDTWVWEALGGLGDDSTVELLLDTIRADTSDARAVSALDALVAIGSDAALLALKTLSEKVKTKRVREGARARIATVAASLGLTADQLADRLVPDLGLRPDGTAILDFGSRRFVIGFDEQLRPTISDPNGRRRKALPKPGVHDDPELAAAATATFRRVKKNAIAIRADQILRMERAMTGGRRFTLDELRGLFIDHPLRQHITRRILWAVYDGHILRRAFRIAADNTFADIHDTVIDLPADAVIGVPHPLDLGPDDTAAWRTTFTEYALLQPFEQLDRAVYREPALADVSAIDAAPGTTVDSARLLGLPRRGWLRPETGDGGLYLYPFAKPLAPNRFFLLEVDPAMHAAAPTDPPERTIRYARLSYSTTVHTKAPTFADLSPLATSEILRDLTWLGGPTVPGR
ncbi:DUF4132 domain-containing protein [Nocardia sp. NPDC050710]|uniref:DUF4132 domain-containing protein n=1 Tax=Nocardia sp. NPDC050710 TaxID=3157220 RepID=UPI0033D8728B